MTLLQVPAQAVLIGQAGTIVVGDKSFSNFTCNVVVVGTGTPANCSGIDVTGSIDQFGNIGLSFQTGANVNVPNSTVDILIRYDATVLDPTRLISDVHLAFNGAITGTGFTNVTETIVGLNPVTGIIGQVDVHNPPPVLDATINLSQLASSIRVTKDIFLGAGSGPGSATVSFVDQFLSQTPVPEPASMVLFGTMMLFTGVVMRSRVGRKISV